LAGSKAAAKAAAGAKQLPARQLPGVASGKAATLPGLNTRPAVDDARPNQLPARGGTAQQRHDNLQNRLASQGDLQQRRTENREDWQAHRDQVREDWQDWHGEQYHGDWHHGYWHGNASEWWNHMWDDHTAMMVFGTTMWGINRAAYGFGYWGYSNPYYTESYPVGNNAVIDYSQPMAAEIPAEPTAAPSETPPAGLSDFDAARQAFYDGNYPAAFAATNKALASMPSDPIIHEFRALVLFAQAKYKEAAAGLYSVLSVGPGWDWTTLSSLYPNVDVYTKQLRALEDYVKQNPKATDAMFVLAYHYLTTGNKDEATKQLRELQKSMPQDKLVQQMLLMTAGPDAATSQPPISEPAQAPTIAAADVVGKWSASGPANAKFALELAQDGKFSWTFTQQGKPQAVQGVYALDANVLAMEPESGGVMLAEITPPQNGAFNFQMLGAPPGDPGLKFVKSK
jgi:uncharacterized protein (TIGR03066 family)